MKLKLQRFIVFYLLVIYLSAPVGAQKKIASERPASKSAEAESRSLRKQQLLILHENLLSRTLDAIKQMDEVALRLFGPHWILK